MASSQPPEPAENGLTLYENPVCPFAQRVLIALAEAGVEYKRVYIDLKNKPAWYPQINPLGQVPALRVEDATIITESLIIIEYIADRFADRAALMPRDPLLRARVRYLINFYDTRVNPISHQLLHATDPAEQKTLKLRIRESLKGFNDLLAKQRQRNAEEGPYFLGKQFSLADLAIAPQIARLVAVAGHYRGFEIPRTAEYAELHRWYDAVRKRPSFKGSSEPDDTYIEGFRRFVPEFNK
ncbi:hypothetical protein EV182_004644 [Spiromyces aspiralis]|uniref:Uncharacterized protein n=1 Tax=Spiromyces aspiralis TaxID=68401 RepID=A0ACC1HSE9_9FUNG|nr:hypothetical protein EV182_004644 [Spiromyces aspiralis]